MKWIIFPVLLSLFIFYPTLVLADTIVSSPITIDTTWSPAGNPYLIDSNFKVESGATLTILPGTIVKGKTTSTYQPSIYGKLIAQGTNSSPILFTSNSDGCTYGSWQGLYFESGSSGDLDHIELACAGHGGYGYGDYVGIENDGGDLKISNSYIHGNYSILSIDGWTAMAIGRGIYNKNGDLSVSSSTVENNNAGIVMDAGSTAVSNTLIKNNVDAAGYGYSKGMGLQASGLGSLILLNNTFSGNDKTAYVSASVNFVHSGNVSNDIYENGFETGGTLAGDSTWTDDLPVILFNSNVTVPAGKTLTLLPGTAVKFGGSSGDSGIYVGGNLVAKGAADKKIYFTSLKDNPAPHDWSSITLAAGSRADLDNVVINYGGYGGYAPNLPAIAALYNFGAILNLSNSKLGDNYGADIFQNGGTSHITNSEFKDSNYAIWSRGGNINVATSSLTGHAAMAIYNESGPQIFARNNWWGASDGPRVLSTTTATGSGDKIAGDILYEPFLTSWPPVSVEIPLTTKAAELAKQVLKAPYLGDGESYGGKGWDSKQALYVTRDEIFSGYNYWNNYERKVAFGAGLDCSGLTQWAYNRSFDPNKSLINNAIRYDSADGQYKNNSEAVSESDLKPGDLLFMDKDKNGNADHVAMYVGDFVYSGKPVDMVEAYSRNVGITVASSIEFESRSGFTNLGVSKAIRQVVLSPKIAGQVKAGSPVDLSVTDPDGLTITASTSIRTDEEYLREVPGELYYYEGEIGPDGNPEDIVYWPKQKIGDYTVQITPDSRAGLNATYSLDFTEGDNTVNLAKDIPINQIPKDGYGITIGANGTIKNFLPVSIDIKPDSFPNSINLKSNGVIPVAIFGSANLDVKKIDVSSIKFGSASVKVKNSGKLQISYADLNGDGFTDILVKVQTKDLGLSKTDSQIYLKGQLADGTIIKGSDTVKIVPQ